MITLICQWDNNCPNLEQLSTHHSGLDARKPVWWFANNTGVDQPVHPHSLISAFVIRFLESIISRLATSEISNF